MNRKLQKNPRWKGRKGPLVLCIMDGVGITPEKEGNGVNQARTETLDRLLQSCPHTLLKAHGTAVGLPSDDEMGNSEVGHNAIGAGRVFAQGAKLVNRSIQDGSLFEGEVWKKLVQTVREKNSCFHFIGLLSDGYVHSHVSHLEALVQKCKEEGVRKVRIHSILDGRDVGETSALEYIRPFEQFLDGLRSDDFDVRIASGGGRMNITMDRYNADWPMVQRGWETHVRGKGEYFASAEEAVETLRQRTGAIDQDLPPFVIAQGGKPVGPVQDGDSVVLFNYRGDRAIEISRAFDEEDFREFDRGPRPDVVFAGMTQYDGDLGIPQKFLVSPPHIDRPLAEYLCDTGLRQFSISETQKYGHITYFFNGNKSEKFSEQLEDYVEIPSDNVSFDQRPAMKCAEIADKVIQAVESGNYEYIKLNFPNGDMVGHTGNLQAVICSLEAMDLSLERIARAVEKAGGSLIVTADHGNADEMYERKKGEIQYNKEGRPKRKTSHTLNPVPFILYDPVGQNEYEPELKSGLGITSITAACIQLLGFLPPDIYDESPLTLR